MITLTEENYLKALYHLSEKSPQVSVGDLSKHLGIKMPSVTSMIRKFEKKQWVQYESYRPLQLTSEGKKLAALIVRKHRLTEMFLVEKMGFGWEEVHEIAEEIEHIKSDKFFAKIDSLLGHPKTDPHGSPIPDKNGEIISYNYKKLSECTVGSKVRFCALAESSNDFLKYLNENALALDTVIEVLHVEPFDQTLTVRYNKKDRVLSEKVTEKLLVEVL